MWGQLSYEILLKKIARRGFTLSGMKLNTAESSSAKWILTLLWS